MQVFISFASEQKELAELVAVTLRVRGYAVFFSKDTLPAAESFDVRIEKAVKSSNLLVFLISPEAVTKGKYTLTELSFAREKWPNGSGHVLPVMIAPTPVDNIPAYLRALNILEPEGSPAADIAAQADKILRKQSLRGVFLIALAGIGTGLLSFVSMFFADTLRIPSLPSVLDAPILPGLLFGALIAFANWKFGVKDKLHLELIVFFTLLAWVFAEHSTELTYHRLTEYTKATAAAADQSAGAAAQAAATADSDRPEYIPFAGALAGMIGGLIGSAGTLLGVAIVNPGLRRIEKILPIVVAATVIGSLVEIVTAGGPAGDDFFLFMVGHLVVFVCWQAAVAGMVARAPLRIDGHARIGMLFRFARHAGIQFMVQPLGVRQRVDNRGEYVLDLVHETLGRRFADFFPGKRFLRNRFFLRNRCGFFPRRGLAPFFRDRAFLLGRGL